MQDIVVAAINGQVETLFYDKNNSFFWGTYDAKTNTIKTFSEREEGAICLINLAVQKTLANGGQVLPMHLDALPRAEAPLNAIYRYTLTEENAMTKANK